MVEIGAVLGGKYRVLAKLGEGGMGAVFRAENMLTGKQVALKCMHPQLRNGGEAAERLLREARAVSNLSHPNVVDIYDVMHDGERLFLVMELLHGQTLRDFLTQKPRPKIFEFVSLLLPAVAGVAAAHERGVIHRDLKPDNIFLERVSGAPNGVAKVLDFGIAKLAAARGQTLTQTGTALGTPLYMSLEQLRGDKDIDARVDVYAFGVMLYQAVTGHMPFEATTLPELAIKVATTDARPVKTLRPDVPKSLARVIDWAIKRDRKQRLPDMQTLLKELDAFARAHSFREHMTNRDAAIPRLRADGRARAEGGAAANAYGAEPQRAAAERVASARAWAAADTMRAREFTPRAAGGRRLPLLLLRAALATGAVVFGVRYFDDEPPVPLESVAASKTSVAAVQQGAPDNTAVAPAPLHAPGMHSIEPQAAAAAPKPNVASLPPSAANPAQPEDALPNNPAASTKNTVSPLATSSATSSTKVAAPLEVAKSSPPTIKPIRIGAPPRPKSSSAATAPEKRAPEKEKSSAELLGF